MSVDQSTNTIAVKPRSTKFRVGGYVRVNSAKQILQTLDANGRCDGLPFMPQMAAYCGQRLMVTRWVNNVCVQEGDGMYFGNLSDAVLLNTERCDGEAQGGCQFACPLTWRTQWLSEADDENISQTCAAQNEQCTEEDPIAVSALIERATQGIRSNQISGNSQPDSNRICCQSTELHQIAPPRSKSDLAQYSDEKNLNRVSATSIATSFCGGMLARIKGQQNGLAGTLKRTPRQDLDLQSGDRVRVKDRDQIVATLDYGGKNRGLWFDPVMLRYCGRELKVTKRVTRIVNEKSGELMQLKSPSIVLEDLHCQPADRRFCSRLLHLFWREIWLERI